VVTVEIWTSTGHYEILRRHCSFVRRGNGIVVRLKEESLSGLHREVFTGGMNDV
jgi:hypothetical protein